MPKKTEPPLHVELSAAAAADLKKIRAARGWNKKTAVENALRFYWLEGERMQFSTK